MLRWLGDRSGWRGLVMGLLIGLLIGLLVGTLLGLLLATLSGAVLPGGPLVQSGIAAGLPRSGAGVGWAVACGTGVLLRAARLPQTSRTGSSIARLRVKRYNSARPLGFAATKIHRESN